MIMTALSPEGTPLFCIEGTSPKGPGQWFPCKSQWLFIKVKTASNTVFKTGSVKLTFQGLGSRLDDTGCTGRG